jgi:hypothetical protein
MEKAVFSDETEYLRSTEANKEWLDAGIAEAERGEGIEIKLEDLWK